MRASLVPAAAVIPAQRVFLTAVAVKTLVVGLRGRADRAVSVTERLFPLRGFCSLQVAE